MTGFFAELQRRKVYRVAVAYIVAGGFIIQIASAVFPAWDLPSWSQRLLIVLILAGFPIALILAWAFDVTPAGIERTPNAETAAQSVSPRRRRNLILLVAAGLVVSIGAGLFILPRATARKIDKSIAVLPFQNLSEEKQNAFFADGIQDDILTNLAKIGDLKVISRTSVMSYRDKPPSVREIGKALGVSAILEGSVRKEKNRVRVNVQLINAENDAHIWAEEYDRDLTDVFAIQSDLAREIATALQAKLSPAEKAQLETKPTENPEAYFAFIQARNLFMPEDARKTGRASSSTTRAPARSQLCLGRRRPLAAAQLDLSRDRSVSPRGENVRVLWRNGPCNCNRICPKAISPSAFPTTMVMAISKRRRRNFCSQKKVCLTSPKFIWPWAQSNGARVVGRSQRRT